QQLDQIEHQDTSPRHQRPSIRQPTDAERTLQQGPHRADTPPMVGNYVTAGVGNYVTDNPSNLGKYVTADTQVLTIAHSGSNCLCRMMVGVKA
ncbi:hypothetical protein, partial [Mycobacterium tuberculosis]